MYQREGAFVYWVLGISMLIGVIVALRRGTVGIWVRYVDARFRRAQAPIRYWMLISVYLGLAIVFVGLGWHEWVWIPDKP